MGCKLEVTRSTGVWVGGSIMKAVFLLACIGLLAGVTPSFAADSETGVEVESAPIRPPGISGFSMGLGTSFFAAAGRLNESNDNLGLALQWRAGWPISNRWRFNLGMTWGLTEFRRTTTLWNAGVALGAWTTRAYRDVHEWSQGNALRELGAMFGYFGLIFGYFGSAVLFILGPFASTTYLQLDAVTSHHFNRGKNGPFAEVGVGLFAYLHPLVDTPGAGLGPLVGLGVRTGAVRLGTRIMWSPPGAHVEPDGERSNIVTVSAVVGFGH